MNMPKISPLLWLSTVVMTIGLGLIWLTPAQAEVCAQPTNLQVAYKNGDMQFSWKPSYGAKGYILELWDEQASSLVKEIHLRGGSLTSLSLNNSELENYWLSCGNYQWRIKAICCEVCGDCSASMPNGFKCEDIAVPNPDPDYEYNNGLNSCLCAENQRPIRFKFIYTSDVTPGERKVLGCSWQCEENGATSFEKKDCGVGYDIGCGNQPNSANRGPGNVVVKKYPMVRILRNIEDPGSTVGWYDLCAIVNPRNEYTFGHSIDVNYGTIPTQSDNKYFNWTCDGEKCASPKLAICGPWDGKLLTGGQVLSPATADLCISDLQYDGAMGVAENFQAQTITDLMGRNPLAKGFAWDCQGQAGNNMSALENQDWRFKNNALVEPDGSCQAPTAGCGRAQDAYLSSALMKTLQDEDDFLCLNGGTPISVENTEYLKGLDVLQGQQGFDQPFKIRYAMGSDNDPNNDQQFVTSGWLWQCSYDNGTPADFSDDYVTLPGSCRAFAVGCHIGEEIWKVSQGQRNYNSAFANALEAPYDFTGYDAKTQYRLTQSSLDKLSELSNIANNDSFWCHNGKTEMLNKAEDLVKLQEPIMSLSDTDVATWKCYGLNGLGDPGDECRIKLTKCGDANGKTYDKLSSIPDTAKCINGQVSNEQTKFDNTGWTWDCADDVGRTVSCEANNLDCQKPPHLGTYKNWDGFIVDVNKNGGSCVGTGDQRNCTGVCTKTDRQVTVKLVNSYLTWSCGTNSCQAEVLTCVKPPHQTDYKDLASLLADVNSVCDDPATGSGCTNLCSIADKKVNVDYDSNTKKWRWSCGEEICESGRITCNETILNQGFFSSLAEIAAAAQAAGGSCGTIQNNSMTCTGLCSKIDESAVVTLKSDGSFSWQCGGDTCSLLQAGCGNLAFRGGSNGPVTAANWNSATKDWQTDSETKKRLCVNGDDPRVTIEWLPAPNAPGQPEAGRVAYQNIDSAWDAYEGGWFWRCAYKNGRDETVYAPAATYADSATALKAGAINVVPASAYYCHNFEEAECNWGNGYGSVKDIDFYNLDGSIKDNPFANLGFRNLYSLYDPARPERSLVGDNSSGLNLGATRGDGFKSDGTTKLDNYTVEGGSLCDRGAFRPYDAYGVESNLNGYVYKSYSPTNSLGGVAYGGGVPYPLNSNEDYFLNTSRSVYLYNCNAGMDAYYSTYNNGQYKSLVDAKQRCQVDVAGCKNKPHTGIYGELSEFYNGSGTTGICESYNDGQEVTLNKTPTLNQNANIHYKTYAVDKTYKCGWSWECGGDSCWAAKDAPGITAPDISLTVDDGDNKYCQNDPDTFTINRDEIKNCREYTINWWVLDKDGKELKGPISALSFRPDLATIGVSLIPGNYKIKVAVTCTGDDAVCMNEADKTVTKIKDVVVESGKTLADTDLSLSGSTGFCSGYTKGGPQYSLTVKNCKKASITWKIKNANNEEKQSATVEVVRGDNDSEITNVYDLEEGLGEGSYKAEVAVKCLDECYSDEAIPKSFNFTIKSKSEPVIEKDKTPGSLCSGKTSGVINEYSVVFDCFPYELTWSLKDKNGKEVHKLENVSDKKTYNIPDNVPADGSPYSLTATLLCKGECASTTTDSVSFDNIIIKPSYEVPKPTLAKPDGIICEATADKKIQSSLPEDTGVTDCPNPKYTWLNDNDEVIGASGDKETLDISTWPAGNYNVKLKLTCDPDNGCVVPSSNISELVTFTITPKTEAPTRSVVISEGPYSEFIICADKPSDEEIAAMNAEYSNSLLADCKNKRFVWKLKDGNDVFDLQSEDTIEDESKINLGKLNRSWEWKTYYLTGTVQCLDDCRDSDRVLDAENQLELSIWGKLEPGAISVDMPEICSGKDTTVNFSSDIDPSGRDANENITWEWGDVLADGSCDTESPYNLVDGANQKTLQQSLNLTTGRCYRRCVSNRGCGQSCTTLVKVNVKDKAEIAAVIEKSDDFGCLGKEIVYTAKNLPADCTNPVYTWTGDFGTSNDYPLKITYTKGGSYNIKLKVECGGCYKDDILAEINFTVYDQPEAGNIKTDQTVCQDEDPIAFVTDGNAPANCDEVGWQSTLADDLGTCLGFWENAKNTYLGENYQPQKGSYAVGHYCFRRYCKNKCGTDYTDPAVKLWIKAITNQKVTLTGAPTKDLCYGVDKATVTATATTNCNPYDFKLFWYNSDDQEQPGGQSGLSPLSINTDDLLPGTYYPFSTLTCNDDNLCARPDIYAAYTNQFKILPTYEAPSVAVDATYTTCAGGDTNNPQIIEPTLDWTLDADESNNCGDNPDRTGLAYTWKKDGVEDGTGLNYDIASLPVGEYEITVEVKCTSGTCVKGTNPATAKTTVKVKNCTCGTAHTKNFVDISKRGSFTLCTDSQTVTPQLNANQDGWTWTCTYGKKTVDCSANKTMCGTAINKNYTRASWADNRQGQTLCINGSNTTPAEKDTVSGNNFDNIGDGMSSITVYDQWEWTCKDSIGTSTSACIADITDCGKADALEILNRNGKLQPVNSSNKYHGSYTDSVVSTHACVNASSLTNPIADRGKFTWSCTDDFDSTEKCEARKDCGWAGDEQYPTVDYGSAGCWTAANVTKDGEEDLNIRTAMKLTSSCTTDLLKNRHCRTFLQGEGQCPEGWNFPLSADWHGLENLLQNSDCEVPRLSSCTQNCPTDDPGDETTWKCAPAGDDETSVGLRDEVTFNGLINEGYWTKTTDSGVCYGNTCPRSLYYYELANRPEISRSADYNFNVGNNAETLTHQLRCFKKNTGGIIKPPEGGDGGSLLPCWGFGCYIIN